MKDKALAIRYSYQRSLGLINKKVGPFESSLNYEGLYSVFFPRSLFWKHPF